MTVAQYFMNVLKVLFPVFGWFQPIQNDPFAALDRLYPLEQGNRFRVN